MIKFNNLSLDFGGNIVFNNISIQVNKYDKIGLIGSNGSGKTTLLNIISKTCIPTSGTISYDSNLKIAHLPQELSFNSNITLKEYVVGQYSKIIEFYHYRNPLIHPTVMFRRSIFNVIGYYNESFSTDQDLELWGRCIKSNIGISNIEKPLLYYNTDGIYNRRTKLSSIYNQILARTLLPANSLKLKMLNLMK